MKVAVISGGMPSDKYPLVGIFAFDQAKALQKIGLEVFFFSIDLRSIRRKRKWCYSCGVKEGIRWYNYSIPIGPIFWLTHTVERIIIGYLYKKAFGKSAKPDVIHAHFGDMGVVADVLKVKYDIPIVLTEHSSFMNMKELPKKVVDKAAQSYSHTDAIIAVSSMLYRNIKEKTGFDSIVIPNIIDTSFFALKDEKYNNGFRIVTTAILSKRKRVDLLLKAVSELQGVLDKIHIYIIGDGEEYGALKTFAEKYLSDGMYDFCGLLSREEAGEIYKKSDCFVLPSSLETFGVVYIEAMSAGLPVIATRCGGPEDFVDDQNGLLIDVDNLQQLKDAIVFMYYNHQRYRPQVIRDSIRNRFSPEVVANQILSVYKKVIK